MKIDQKLLGNLEKLSALYVEEEKKEEILQQLNEIIGYVENLNELDTTNVDSYFSTLEGGTPIREDVVKKDENISNEILKHAPNSDDNFFIVPAIIE